MLLHLQGYDFQLEYKPGKEMVLADMLLRYNPAPGDKIQLDITIHVTNISEEAKSDFQHEITTSAEMTALVELILKGWPDTIKDVPQPL